jgi:hypothetical protein
VQRALSATARCAHDTCGSGGAVKGAERATSPVSRDMKVSHHGTPAVLAVLLRTTRGTQGGGNRLVRRQPLPACTVNRSHPIERAARSPLHRQFAPAASAGMTVSIPVRNWPPWWWRSARNECLGTWSGRTCPRSTLVALYEAQHSPIRHFSFRRSAVTGHHSTPGTPPDRARKSVK